jgi:hypothetical protein
MFYIGVDLGQKHDYTAIAVVEKENARLMNRDRVYNAQAAVKPRLLVRRAQRVALGTPYPRVAEMIREITREWPMAGQCTLVVDATGVGAPVVDMLRAPGLGCDLTAVTITGGDRESRQGPMNAGVPRRDLIAGLQLAIEKGELRVARGMAGAGSLIRELTEMRVDDGGGEHDDLVMALALACWKARMPSVWGTVRLPGI